MFLSMKIVLISYVEMEYIMIFLIQSKVCLI